MRTLIITLALLLLSGRVWAEPESYVPIMTIALEAQGESMEGQVAVGEVIRNRANKARRTFEAVCLAKYQFSCWNALEPSKAGRNVSPEAYQRAARAWEASEASNLTGGAVNYYNPRLASPRWAKQGVGRVVIGEHVFMKLKGDRK